MRRISIAGIMLVGFVAVAYLLYSAQTQPRLGRDNKPIPTAVPPIPWMTHWGMGDSPIVSQGGFSFATHIIHFNSEATTVIYTMSGASFVGPPVATTIQMVDDVNGTYALNQADPLAQLNQLQIGVLNFDVCDTEARELHLLVRPSQEANPLDAFIAKVSGPDLPCDLYGHRSTHREGYYEQGGYRISFNGWGLSKGDLAGSIANPTTFTMEELRNSSDPLPTVLPLLTRLPVATPSRIPESSLANDLALGVPIETEATLRIEHLQTHVVTFLYIVFLRNGDVKAMLLPE